MPRLELPISNVAVASCAPRENSSAGLGARSTYCPVMLATRPHGGRVDVQVEHVGDELRRCSGEIDALDASGNLRLGGFAEFELVEDVAGNPVVPVGIPQSVERTGWIVRAWRRQFLMPCLQAEGRRHRRKARVERHHLHFEAALLFLVGEFLPDADG
jgi:hypothetical protein